MIAIGCDHGGYNLKKAILAHLNQKGYAVKDFGCYDLSEVDYPEYGVKVAKAVQSGECEKGILICGTGIGISLAANKVEGIRAAVCTDTYMARMSREHNNANILALGERVVGQGLAVEIVDAWLKSEFIGDKHERRVQQIMGIEKEKHF